MLNVNLITFQDVCHYAKIRILKQITTVLDYFQFRALMFVTIQS